MFNLDDITTKNNKKHKDKYSNIADHHYRILIMVGSGPAKTSALLNLIKEQNDINKIHLYAEDLSEPKYQFLIKKHENAGIKHLNDSNAFTECSNSMDDVYDEIDEYNLTKKKINCVWWYDVDIMTNKKFQTIIKELFIWCRKLNILLVLITYFFFLFQKKSDEILNIT